MLITVEKSLTMSVFIQANIKMSFSLSCRLVVNEAKELVKIENIKDFWNACVPPKWSSILKSELTGTVKWVLGGPVLKLKTKTL